MSPRQQVAENLADTCIFSGLNESYGVSCERATDKKGKEHWSILFAKAANLDGHIRVYSPTFILISWVTRYHNLPHKGSQMFKSEYEAKRFLIDAFVNFKEMA